MAAEAQQGKKADAHVWWMKLQGLNDFVSHKNKWQLKNGLTASKNILFLSYCFERS